MVLASQENLFRIFERRVLAMRCPECGKYVGHEPWCREADEPLTRRSALDDLLDNRRNRDEDDFTTPIKPLLRDPPPRYEPEPFLPYEPDPLPKPDPLRSIFQRDDEERPRIFDDPRQRLRLGDDLRPGLGPDPLLTSRPSLPDPLRETFKSDFQWKGIVKTDTGLDTGIRFTEGGIIKNEFGHNVGNFDGPLVYNHEGHLVGKIDDAGRLLDLNGLFIGKKIDSF